MYKLVRNSMVRMIVDAGEVFGDKVQYYDWDAHAENFKLPETDLFGLQGFSMTENNQFHDITFGVGIMTLQDRNLSKMVSYMDALYLRLQAQARVAILNDDGSSSGHDCVIFDGTSATPIVRVDQRPAMSINCSGRVGFAGFKLPQ